MNKLLILCVVVLLLSIVYIIKFRETFSSPKCSDLDIYSINPNHPDCISKCIHDYTWTEDNIEGNFSKKSGDLNDKATSASLKTSNCFKCMRNFYHSIKLIKDNTCSN